MLIFEYPASATILKKCVALTASVVVTVDSGDFTLLTSSATSLSSLLLSEH